MLPLTGRGSEQSQVQMGLLCLQFPALLGLEQLPGQGQQELEQLPGQGQQGPTQVLAQLPGLEQMHQGQCPLKAHRPELQRQMGWLGQQGRRLGRHQARRLGLELQGPPA